MRPSYDIQIETILTQRDSTGRSLLANAAYRGDLTTFEAVVEAVQNKLGIDQVWLELFLIFIFDSVPKWYLRLASRPVESLLNDI